MAEVSGQPLGPNESRGLHWARVARDRAVFRDAFALLLKAQHSGPPFARAQVEVVLVRRAGQQPRDPDNMVSAAKGPVDGVVAAGVLVDDSAQHIDLVVRQEEGPQRAVRLVVAEIVL